MTDQNDTTQWKRMRFKRNKVWLAVDDGQRPILEKGKVLIKYQLDQSHEYWVHPSGIHPLDDTPADQQAHTHQESTADTQAQVPTRTTPSDMENSICIYTDGASSGNPGPAGIGVVMIYLDKRKELSRHIGIATNNVAELEAIRQGLAAVKNRKLPVIVFTDSSYAIGVLTQGWKAELNRALVTSVRDLIKKFRQVQLIKVRGHAGHPENERADRLAVKAAQAAKRG